MSSLMIVSAALTNWVAKFPCVTTTPPIIGIKLLIADCELRIADCGLRIADFGLIKSSISISGPRMKGFINPQTAIRNPQSLLHVPMHHSRVLFSSGEMLADRVCDGHRAMFASGAPHPDGDIALAFALVERQQEIEQFAEAANGFARFLALIQIFNDRLVVAVHVFQLGDEMRVGQEA